jgi:hypothetical protein
MYFAFHDNHYHASTFARPDHSYFTKHPFKGNGTSAGWQ